jgi:nucleotide-binding universal stress UspA family protein
MNTVKTIVAAIDLSDTSRDVLRWARLLAERFEASLRVVHVVPDLKAYMGFYLTEKPIDTIQSEMDVEAEEKLLWLAREHLGEAKNGKLEVLRGHATSSLVKYLKDSNADLVVVGCHGHAKPEHKLFGSTAEQLLKISPCPVVTVGQELLPHE